MRVNITISRSYWNSPYSGLALPVNFASQHRNRLRSVHVHPVCGRDVYLLSWASWWVEIRVEMIQIEEPLPDDCSKIFKWNLLNELEATFLKPLKEFVKPPLLLKCLLVHLKVYDSLSCNLPTCCLSFIGDLFCVFQSLLVWFIFVSNHELIFYEYVLELDLSTP